MTKDEAIEVLRESLKRLRNECDLEGLRKRAGFDHWMSEADKALAATFSIEASTSEAVAWIHDSGFTRNLSFSPSVYGFPPNSDAKKVTPLYAAPAQPAADPAPVPAQGIDHAKLAEGSIAEDPEFIRLLGEVQETYGETCSWHHQTDLQLASDNAEAALIAYLDGWQAGVPEGCVIVPKRMTDAMRDAGNEILCDRSKLNRVWSAMIAAAAAPGEAG